MEVLTFYDNFRHRIGSLLYGRFTDAILLVEGVEIPVHRNILAVQSEYFSHLISTKNSSGKTSGSQAIVETDDVSHCSHHASDVTPQHADNVFELRNTKVEVVRAVLDYFYRGEYIYHNNVETHWLAVELANQFNLRDLVDDLINKLVIGIRVENFVDFYNMKMRFKNVQLENSVVSFLKENGEEIAKSENFFKLTRVSLLSLLDEESFAAAEIDIFRAAERWVGVNKPNKKTVKDIVKRIRLATISQEDLFYVVKRSKELPSIDILEAVQSDVNKDATSTNFQQQPPKFGPAPDHNVAQSSLGAEVLSGSVRGADLISGSSGCTSHKVGGKPDCIVVKLDKTYWINALQLLLDSSEGRSYKYHVEVSVNEKEWLRVFDRYNYWCRCHQFLSFDPMAVRFIRMTGTDENLKIISIKAIFTDEDCSLVQEIQFASTNVVLESRGANVTGGYCVDPSFEPMLCIDGKEDSWAVLTEYSPLIIKLGQPHWLSSLRVKIGAWGSSYTIESSPDGESWHLVGGETKGEWDAVWRTFEFSGRVVLHFRVTMKEIEGYHISLFHFESPASTTAVTN